MTLTIQIWMLIPAGLVLAAVLLFWVGSRQSGLMAGFFESVAGLALLLITGAFLLGRWLA